MRKNKWVQEVNLVKYYKCGRNENKIDDITKTIYFAINLGGLYDENTIVPTTVSTIWYDNKISKEIFNDLRKIMKRHVSTTINGYMILKMLIVNSGGIIWR